MPAKTSEHTDSYAPDRGCFVWQRCADCPLPRCLEDLPPGQRKAALGEVRRALGMAAPLSQRTRAGKRRGRACATSATDTGRRYGS